MVRSLEVKDFHLRDTIECGQFFRYDWVGEWCFISHRDDLFKVKQVGGRETSRLYYAGIDKKTLIHFFSLDVDLENIKRRISVDKHVRAAVKNYHGLRLIRQDPWECTISFICSANSNIPRIRKNLNALAREFGAPVELDGVKSHTFPAPGGMRSLSRLRRCGVGYRDKYLLSVNKVITSAWFDDLRRADHMNAKTALLSLMGVGEKVADCILLFSLGHHEAFPVDTWVRKVMQKLYFGGRDVPLRRIREFASDYFGKEAGYAQQYLFHSIRNR